MKYKLLVLDLDGTLTNAKKEITPRNREALIRVQQQGVKLILASGRPTFGIAPLADELRMKEFGGFILSYNGGEIIDWSTGEIVYANGIAGRSDTSAIRMRHTQPTPYPDLRPAIYHH